MSHATEVLKADDDKIQFDVETSLGRYYRVGKKIAVRNSGPHWLCLTCQGNDRWENLNSHPEHKGCVHIQRVKEWVEDGRIAWEKLEALSAKHDHPQAPA